MTYCSYMTATSGLLTISVPNEYYSTTYSQSNIIIVVLPRANIVGLGSQQGNLDTVVAELSD